MKRLLTVLVTSILIVITSCKKVGDAGVMGTVREKGTGLPFPNAKVYVERTTKSGLNSNLQPTIVASTVTDINGQYNLSFFMKFNHYYNLYCLPVEDSNGKTYSGKAFERLTSKDEKIDLKLPPFAYMKVYLNKTSSTVTQSAWLVFDNSQSIDLDVPNYPFNTILGVYRVKGNDSITVWWQQNYNTPTVYAGSSSRLYINKGDTLSYFINFD